MCNWKYQYIKNLFQLLDVYGSMPWSPKTFASSHVTAFSEQGFYIIKTQEMYWTRITFLLCLFTSAASEGSSFDNRYMHWWGYDHASGPDKWGAFAFPLCKGGKQQSPIDIQPKLLLFDPNLKHVRIENQNVNGVLVNTGNDITFKLDQEFTTRVNISEGPLSYGYHVTSIKFHFSKKGNGGSEHKIEGHSFPAELHIIGYNGDLYPNMSRAENSSNGVVIISTFLQTHTDEVTRPNQELDILMNHFDAIRHVGNKVRVNSFSISDLLPNTNNYITYEGSLTQPSCQETVTWIIFNKPTYVKKRQLDKLRGVNMEWVSNNCRPPMPLNHRVVRTNINTSRQTGLCSMKRDLFYQVNSIFQT